MSGRTKVMAAIYCTVLMATALAGIAFAEPGATCAATWTKILRADGTAVFGLNCQSNGCTAGCTRTGTGDPAGTTFVTCRCPGDLIHCNAAIRLVVGWSSEEQCLGGCTQAQTELCPNIEEEPWVFDGWTGKGEPIFTFVCDCVSA